MILPTDDAARKAIPVYTGFVKYFPRAMSAVAELSRIANEQHHPGQPVHWDKSKSTQHLDSAMRHILDDVLNVPVDTDNVRHKTKVAWRAMADLEVTLENEEKSRFKEVEPLSYKMPVRDCGVSMSNDGDLIEQHRAADGLGGIVCVKMGDGYDY